MDTLSEMRSAVQSDLNVDSNSTLFTPTRIDVALNRAYQKAGALFRWPALSDGKDTTTQANIEYYDAPSTFRPFSIYRLYVDSEIYGESPDGSPMDFNDYQTWKLDNSTSTDKKWTIFKGFYFIHPTPTAAGLEICVWGQKNITEMSEDASTTIFSYSMPEGNEALVLEASAILKKKGEDVGMGQMFSEEAKLILALSFDKIKKEKTKTEKIQPFFDVPDYYGPANTKNIIGNFR